MTGVQIDLISSDRLSSMTPMEKVRLILDEVKQGKILVLESGLEPTEETKLIESTMLEVTPEGFIGIEMESYPQKHRKNIFEKIFGKNPRTRLTVIGPANQLKTLHKDKDLISALVSAREA